MAMVCNDCELRGKRVKQIWCKHTGEPCMHVRYCAVSMKYYQTDAAAFCPMKKEKEKK